MVEVIHGRDSNFFMEASDEYNLYHWIPLRVEQIPDQARRASADALRDFALSFHGIRYKLTDRLPGILGPWEAYDGFNCQQFAELMVLHAYGVASGRLGVLDDKSISEALTLYAIGTDAQ